MVRRHQRIPLVHGHYLVVFQAARGVNLIGGQIHILRLVHLQVKGRGPALRAHQLAHGGDGDQFAPALAMREDAGDAEGTLQNGNRIAHVMPLAGGGEDVVHHHVVRPLHWPAGEKDEGAQPAVAGVIDAPQHLQPVGHGQVGDHRRGHGNVRQRLQHRGQFGRDGRAAHAVEKDGVAGTDDEVGADAVVQPLLAGQLSHHDGDDGEHHDDFNGHGQHADDGAQGPMQQIGEDELIHCPAMTPRGRKAAKPLSFRLTASGRQRPNRALGLFRLRPGGRIALGGG